MTTLATRLIVLLALLGGFALQSRAQELEDFETFTPGVDVLSRPSQGLTFTNALRGVRCDTDPVVRGNSNCLSARSGNTVVQTLVEFEFTRDPYRINFAAPQESVDAYVRLDASAAFDGEPVRVSIGAVDEEGDIFKSRAINFTHDFDDGVWHRVEITENLPFPPIQPEGQKIYGVVIWGQVDDGSLPTADEAVNFLLVDDLGFNRVEALPEDNLAPSIRRFTTQAIVDLPFVPTELEVEERGPSPTARLDRIELRVEHEGGTVISDFADAPICGGSSAPCPPLEFVASDVFQVGLQEDLPGEYTITVRACDVSDNCTQQLRRPTYEPAPTPPEVRSWMMEINQGLQELDGLVEPAQIGIATYPGAAGPYLPNRNTLVRYYLVADGEVRENYQTTMTLKVWRGDGSVPSYTIAPNAAPTSVDVEIDPVNADDRRSLAWSQRPLLSKTLNFVIPRELIEDATMFAVRLGQFGIDSDPVTGEMQVALRPPNRFGIIPILVGGSQFTRPNSNDLEQQKRVLTAEFPISGPLLYPNTRSGRWAASTGEFDPNISRRVVYPAGRSADCERVLSWTRSTFAGDIRTLTRSLADAPDLAVVAGFVGNGLVGCAGMAYRPGNTSINEVLGGLVTDHEIMHNLGARHASNAHGEADGGSFEPWPYPHGFNSPDGISNFGVLMDQTGTTSFAGEWDVFLMDPCPTTPLDDLAARLAGCPIPEQEVLHDFMSYAFLVNRSLGIPLGGLRFNWMSDINWDRAFEAISSARKANERRAKGDPGNELVMALIIAGQVNADGSLTLERLLRKTLPRAELTASVGDHTLRVLNGSGQLIIEHGFSVGRFDSRNGNDSFWIAIENPAQANSLELVAPDTSDLGGITASDNIPSVTLLSPNGGEVINTGEITISWEGSDADGDALNYLVQASADNGQTWIGLTLTEPGDPTTVTLATAGLIPSETARIRVVASDGFHTAMDDSDGPFELVLGGGFIFRNGFER